MKKRIVYIIAFFMTVLLIFVCQKPLFMLYNSAAEKGVAFGDYLQVMWRGLSLDAAVCGYLVAVPFLLILVSVWFHKIPLRKLLLPYYAVIALLVAVVFVVDMGLYPFWGFKLDASIILYLDSPEEAMASVSIGFLLIRVLLMLVLSVLLAWLMLKVTPRKVEAVKNRLLATLIMLLIGGVLFVIIRGGVTESTSIFIISGVPWALDSFPIEGYSYARAFFQDVMAKIFFA